MKDSRSEVENTLKKAKSEVETAGKRESVSQSKGEMENPDKFESESQGQFNNIGQFIVTRGNLPLSCPMAGEPLWDAHPRVYLPIEEAGEVTCPYCSAQYILDDFVNEVLDEDHIR